MKKAIATALKQPTTIVNLTSEELSQRQAEEAIFLSEQTANAWLRGRTGEDGGNTGYASVQEQLDMQYNDKINGTITWENHIASVKATNPKPV